jgi:hypothetical protein
MGEKIHGIVLVESHPTLSEMSLIVQESKFAQIAYCIRNGASQLIGGEIPTNM